MNPQGEHHAVERRKPSSDVRSGSKHPLDTLYDTESLLKQGLVSLCVMLLCWPFALPCVGVNLCVYFEAGRRGED